MIATKGMSLAMCTYRVTQWDPNALLGIKINTHSGKDHRSANIIEENLIHDGDILPVL